MTSAILTRDTLVLNKAWIAIATTPVRHALSLVFTGTAHAIEPESFQTHGFESWVELEVFDHEPFVSTVDMRIRAPEVIVLQRYSGVPRQVLPFTRRNLVRRDGATCQYCGRQPGHADLSIDHVVPRSRGGGTSWENCVLACVQCNRRKGSKHVADAGMRLVRRPVAPQWSPIFDVAGTHQRDAWRRFLSDKHWKHSG